MILRIHVQLPTMIFSQFFIWGTWFMTMGTYLFAIGFKGSDVGASHSTTGWAAILSPFFIGMVADRFFAAEKVDQFGSTRGCFFCGLLRGSLLCCFLLSHYWFDYSLIVLWELDTGPGMQKRWQSGTVRAAFHWGEMFRATPAQKRRKVNASNGLSTIVNQRAGVVFQALGNCSSRPERKKTVRPCGGMSSLAELSRQNLPDQ